MSQSKNISQKPSARLTHTLYLLFKFSNTGAFYKANKQVQKKKCTQKPTEHEYKLYRRE